MLLWITVTLSLLVEITTLILALFNISREKHSFHNVIRVQLGFPQKVSPGSMQAPWKAFAVAKEPSKDSQVAAAEFAVSSIPKPYGPSGGHVSSKDLVVPAAKAWNPDNPPAKISQAAIGTAYRNRAVVVACLVGSVGAIDPLGLRGIIGLGAFISILGFQLALGYFALSQWAFMWITFLEDLNQQSLESFTFLPWLRITLSVISVTNYISTGLTAFFFAYDVHSIGLSVSWLILQATWIITPTMFAIICTKSSLRAIHFLQEGQFAKQNHSNIVNLKRKMLCANLAFGLAVTSTLIAVIDKIPLEVGIGGQDPPLWYFFLLMIAVPQCWCFVLGFNWIWKIEVVTSAPVEKKSVVTSSNGANSIEPI